MKVLLVFGTRPEAIKMCPVVKELERHKEIEVVVCVTGQHREMLAPILETFYIRPQYDLHIMKESQTLFDVTEAVLTKIREVLFREQPTAVMVHGDTTSAFAAALACYYMRIPICHVEAGLRTYNNKSPYPEEFNRQAVDAMTDIFFAPTERAKKNLLSEGKEEKDIYVTGNTVIDALHTTIRPDYTNEVLDWVKNDRMILLTAHRRENIGNAMSNMFKAIRNVAEQFDDVKIVYPVHMNPAVRKAAKDMLDKCEHIRLVEPLNVIDFHNLMNHAYFIMTDSGGIQEEAPSLGKPVLVLRDTTERPEGVEAGTLKLTGTSCKEIEDAMYELLTNKKEYQMMADAKNPYGDGKASERIVKILLEKWG